MAKVKVEESSRRERFDRHLQALNEEMVVGEPPNAGPRLGHFVAAVDGIGRRAREQGTVALGVRVRRPA